VGRPHVALASAHALSATAAYGRGDRFGAVVHRFQLGQGGAGEDVFGELCLAGCVDAGCACAPSWRQRWWLRLVQG
jgi:hypothetical protein